MSETIPSTQKKRSRANSSLESSTEIEPSGEEEEMNELKRKKKNQQKKRVEIEKKRKMKEQKRSENKKQKRGEA